MEEQYNVGDIVTCVRFTGERITGDITKVGDDWILLSTGDKETSGQYSKEEIL